VNFETDPLHCGECGQRCDRNEVCVGGECRQYAPAFCNTCPCSDACNALIDGRFQCCAGSSAAMAPILCVEGGDCPVN
jgi:hypothetical protein